MKENQIKAFDYASSFHKHLITISVAIITLGVGNLGGLDSIESPSLLIFSFWCLIFSIFFGLFTHMNLTGYLDVSTLRKINSKIELENKNASELGEVKQKRYFSPDDLTIYKKSIQLFGFAQLSSFFIAVVCFGFIAQNFLKNGKDIIVEEPIYCIVPIDKCQLFSKQLINDTIKCWSNID
ncbi:hypothetical protein [Cyclobacterium plantarum]|uniref:Uncharacterized protein n=1 Tax=Cyclobacterium plantarum TaxID=2716263 RepID=A0ABX0H9A9_9BACT|nr:hypothetical protein [Cyclobacterium plantarum]NHE58485.1 hypothetical protein [Cyclobacterium plantarum]